MRVPTRNKEDKKTLTSVWFGARLKSRFDYDRMYVGFAFIQPNRCGLLS